MKLKETYQEEDEKIVRAAMIPFYIKDGKIFMMFMQPSDPKFGGTRWQLCKGGIDKGETPSTAAVREAKEELGLRMSNTKKLFALGNFWSGKLHLFVVEVKDPKAFDKPGFETKATKWMNWGDWFKEGRREQTKIVSAGYKVMNLNIAMTKEKETK